LPRTFVGYAIEDARPRRMVLAVGASMTFADAVALLQRYLTRCYRTDCAEAMALDGGGPSRIVFRGATGLTDAFPTSTSVPTALLVTAPAL